MLGLIAKVLVQVIEVATPEVRRFICDELKKLHDKAKMTRNPWDDLLVELLIKLLACE